MTAAAQVAVGLDVGTSGAKAVAVDEAGAVLGVAERPYPVSMPRPGWSEQDPDAWVEASTAAIAAAADGRSVAGIGLTGQMHGLVLLDDDDHVLRPAILWNDQRSAPQCDAIEERIGLDRLVAWTGNRPLPGFTAPKLLWVRDVEPDVYARIRRVLLPKDHVRFRLTGEVATDVSDASGTLWFDVARRSWSDDVLDALDVDPSWLPPVAESSAPTGKTDDGAVVVAGAGDQAAAALGIGIDGPGPVSVVLGTSGVVFAASSTYRADPEGRLHAFCHAVPETWHLMGVMLSAAASLAWFRDAFAPEMSFDQLTARASSVSPGADGLLFVPYLIGERTPHADSNVRGAFLGIDLRHDVAAFARAVLEGVAYALRDAFELLRAAGVDPPAARLTGGGARSNLWTSIVASVLGVPVERVHDRLGPSAGATAHGSAAGAAALASVGIGWVDDEHAAAARVDAHDVVEPDPALGAAYDAGYGRFTAAYPAIRAVSSIPTREEPHG